MYRWFVCGVILASSVMANIIRIPSNYPTITEGLQATEAGDSVIVERGIYGERIVMPEHDIVLSGEYLFSRDTTDIRLTIIDASEYADDDTAAVLTVSAGQSSATLICGFTIRGGHGNLNPDGYYHGGGINIIQAHPTIRWLDITENTCNRAVALYCVGSRSTISHCRMFRNCGVSRVVEVRNNIMSGDSLRFEWNEIYDNYGCNSQADYLIDGGLGARDSRVIIRYNTFRDYTSFQFVGIELYSSRAHCVGNRFERITSEGAAYVLMTSDDGAVITDNEFRDCSFVEGWCVSLAYDQGNNIYPSTVANNWFENIRTSFGPAAIYEQAPLSHIHHNTFVNCESGSGAIQFSLSDNFGRGCRSTLEFNQFVRNVCPYPMYFSAVSVIGQSPFCIFRSNIIEGNIGLSVGNLSDSSQVWDLSNNYWGDSTGPYHPTENPNGRGDTVDVNIHVTPWLTEPPDLGVDVRERLKLNPEDWSLEQVFPNPFNGQTNIRIVSRKPQPLSVAAYNTLGQKIADIWQGVLAKDESMLIRWDGINNVGRPVASGVYYIVAQPRGSSGGAPKAQKAVLIR